MPGKNQTKRKNKNIAHAKLVWTRKALGAANAWAAIKDAVAIIEQSRGELTDEDFQSILHQVEQQRGNISAELTRATEQLYEVLGKEAADLHVAGFLPESIQEQLVELA